MGDFRGLYFLASYSYRQESIAKTARTGCRGGTPSWGRSLLKPSVLSNLATAITETNNLDKL